MSRPTGPRHHQRGAAGCRLFPSNEVCDWEQKAHDAGLTGNWVAAQQYKEWAFSAELCASKASQAFTALFADTVNAYASRYQVLNH
jgi:hypothetical protein